MTQTRDATLVIGTSGQRRSRLPLTLGRLLVGSLVLGAVVMVRGPQWPAARDWRLLLVCGLLWFGVYNVALNAAEQRVDAGTTAMLVNIGPLILAVLAGVLLGEGFPRRLVVGSYALGVVAEKPLLSRLPALEVTWLACTIGAVACLPFLPRLLSEGSRAHVSTLAWVAYLGGALCLLGVAVARRTRWGRGHAETG